jgi:hypothetical protein
MPSNEARNSDTSRSSWAPVTRSSIASTAAPPVRSTLMPSRPAVLLGRSSRRSERPSMKRVMRSGASRKSSAFWAGGVSSTIRS